MSLLKKETGFLVLALLLIIGCNTSHKPADSLTASEQDTLHLLTLRATSLRLPVSMHSPTHMFDSSQLGWESEPGSGPLEGVYFIFDKPANIDSIYVDFGAAANWNKIDKITVYSGNTILGSVSPKQPGTKLLSYEISSMFLQLTQMGNLTQSKASKASESMFFVSGTKKTGIKKVTFYDTTGRAFFVNPPLTVEANFISGALSSSHQLHNVYESFDGWPSTYAVLSQQANTNELEATNLSKYVLIRSFENGKRLRLSKIKIKPNTKLSTNWQHQYSLAKHVTIKAHNQLKAAVALTPESGEAVYSLKPLVEESHVHLLIDEETDTLKPLALPEFYMYDSVSLKWVDFYSKYDLEKKRLLKDRAYKTILAEYIDRFRMGKKKNVTIEYNFRSEGDMFLFMIDSLAHSRLEVIARFEVTEINKDSFDAMLFGVLKRKKMSANNWDETITEEVVPLSDNKAKVGANGIEIEGVGRIW